MDKLEEFRANLLADVRAEAEENSQYDALQFLETVSTSLNEDGKCPVAVPCYYQRTGRRNRKLLIHGYNYDDFDNTMSIFVNKDTFEEKEQKILSDINKTVNPDHIELESDLALIAVVGRGMKSTRGTAGRIFSALAHAHINVKMIDQGSSELNIIIGVRHEDFKNAIRALYEIFVLTQI